MDKTAENRVICPICPRHCSLAPGEIGFCRARKNTGGSVTCINYGKLLSLALDPIEKKPFRRFHEGSSILSAGSFGCNLSCPFCQNHQISMASSDTFESASCSPEALRDLALETKDRGNIGVAFTYNEPLIGYEYVYDCARLLKEAGLSTVLVTNGYICREPLEKLLPYIDAMNIDLKCFTAGFYEKTGGRLDTVKDTITLAASKCHVEVTTLVIPGENDSHEEMDSEAAWLASVDPDIALHVSRFFPAYKMKEKTATPVSTVYSLAEIARRHLRYVYTGNC